MNPALPSSATLRLRQRRKAKSGLVKLSRQQADAIAAASAGWYGQASAIPPGARFMAERW